MEQSFIAIASEGIRTALYMAAIPLAASLAVGFLVSIFQAVTSIQEQTLTFVPKIFVTGLVLMYAGPRLFNMMNSYAVDLFSNLHNFVR